MTRRSSRSARRAIADASRTDAPTPTPPPAGSAPASDAASSRRRSSRRGAKAEEATPARGGSSRRRRGGGSGGGTGESRRPAIDRDGKASISCPNCSARYKIAEASLESKVTCTQCHRTFFPLAAAGSRRPQPNNAKPIIYGIVAVVAIIVVGVIVNSMSKPVRNPEKVVADKPPVDLRNTKEVSVVKAWAAAVGTKDRLNTIFNTDMGVVQKKFGIEKKNPYDRSFGAAQAALGEKICDVLFDADETLVFRAYKPSYGRVSDEAMLEKKEGTVRLSLAPRDSSIHAESAEVLVSYGWHDTDSRFKVRGWKVQTMARAEMLMEKVDKKNPTKKHQTHELIGKGKLKKTTFGGEKVEIFEAELVPLPHLATTKPEDQKKIDALIEQMVDLSAPGMTFNRASNALEEFGKAAVPRVLNKMYETKMKTSDDVVVVNRLCRFLRHLTGERFAFNIADQKAGSDIGGTEAERVSAVKQWYAWWGRYHDRDNWRNMDSDEEIELTSDQIDAKRKAEAEAERKARAERRKRARGK